MSAVFAGVFGCYILITTVATYLIGKRSGRSVDGFFLGNRSLNSLLAALSYAATTYSAFMMVGLVGLAYASGIGALIFELIYLVSTLLLLSWLGPKIWRLARRYNLVTPFDLLRCKFNNRVALLASLLSLVALIPYTAVQIIGAALILETFGIAYAQAVAILTVVVVLWAVMGGIRGIALSDALQGLFMLLVAILVLFWSSNRFSGLELSNFPNEFWSPAFFINLTLPWCFFAISNPPVLQRLFMLNDCGKSLRRMMFLFGGFGLVFTLIVTVIGFQASYGSSHGLFPPLVASDNVSSRLMLYMPPWLALSLAISIVIASITTANSILLSLSSIASLNLLRQGANAVLVAKIFMAVAGLAIALFAYFRSGYIVELSVASSRYLMVTVPTLLAALWPQRIAPAAALASITTGLVTLVFANIYLSLYASLLGFSSSVAALLLVQLVYRWHQQFYLKKTK